MLSLDDILVNLQDIITSTCTPTQCTVTYSKHPTSSPLFHLTSTCTKSLEPESYELLSTNKYKQLQHDINQHNESIKQEKENTINRELSQIQGLHNYPTYIRKGFTKINKEDIDSVKCSGIKCTIKYHTGKHDKTKIYKRRRKSK